MLMNTILRGNKASGGILFFTKQISHESGNKNNPLGRCHSHGSGVDDVLLQIKCSATQEDGYGYSLFRVSAR